VKTKSIPSSWLRRDDHRFDAGPYTSGALEARIHLEELRVKKNRLYEVTQGGMMGLVNPGRIKRLWVTDPSRGIPFLSSTDILQADLSRIRLISNRAVDQNPRLLIAKGSTLITRAGTVGRMCYVRPDMDSMACTEDVLRVIPNKAEIPPGYLFAFMCGRFGVPLVTSGTYGAIIQHIEPEHIADLPVPRFDESMEWRVHDLVQEAANARSLAMQMIGTADAALEERLGLAPLNVPSVSRFSTAVVSSSSLKYRFDAPYHSAAASEADAAIKAGPFEARQLVDVVRRYFKPSIFKRIWVDGTKYGRQFISGSDAYRFQAEEVRYVSSRTPSFEEFILQKGMVIFQAAGQIGGLFARPLLVVGWLDGLFAADDLYRLVPWTLEDGAYLYGFFRTVHGQVLLKRQACGNSIPRIWDPQIKDVRIPWPDETVRHGLSAGYLLAHQMLEKARQSENEALSVVERAIREAGLCPQQ
jgi:type I restriction enzyme S subunit